MPRILDLLFICTFLYTCFYTGVSFRCEKPEWFKCANGKCIMFLLECDGDDDCGDSSDEQNCTNFEFKLPSYLECTENEFKCKSKGCIPAEKFCDAVSDCADGSDEYVGCVKKLQCDDKFRCDDGHCITKEWVCDGTKDCPDDSDEQNCGNKTFSTNDCNIENDRYLCGNQRCISLSTVCDEKNNCGDGSDEGDACKNGTSLCILANCSHACKMTPNGPVCTCPLGYKLQDNYTCTDINECASYGICDQRCVNTPGSYICACQEDYELQTDEKTCKAKGGEATMIFSTKTEIRGMYLDSQVYFIAVRNLSHAVAVAIDGDYIYWSEMEGIDELLLRGSIGGKNEVIVTTGLHLISDIIVDWITGNIYFTDDGYMRIGVCNNNGTYCAVLIHEKIKPRGLALMPTNGIMYWCNWGSNAYIAMAGMDGKNINNIVTENVGWPNDVVIDYSNNRLYWIDAKLSIIESIRLDGTDRRIVLQNIVKHPFSLAFFENKLYWSDWDTKTIQSCDKFSGKDWKILVKSSNVPYGVHIDHPAIKPKTQNPCDMNPCSQLCLLNRNKGYTCACTLDKELTSDQHMCRDTKKKQHIIIAARNTFIDYYHEFLGKPKVTSSITLKLITAVTYDSLSGTVLASDQLTDYIIRYNPINGNIENLISAINEMLGGMAFDHIGNNLYLSNIEDETIEVYSLDTMAKTVFYFKEKPYDIALVPEEGVMFVVFREKDKYRIDKMQMNGLGPRVQFVQSNLLGPKVSLYYDRDLKTIYWSDQGTGRIESATLTGNNHYVLRNGLKEPVSLAVVGDQIFWTQRGLNRLFWTNKNNVYHNNRGVSVHMPNGVKIPHLIVLHGIVVHEENGCRKNNGNCSHVCLSSSATSYICACPPEMMLSANNRTCSLQSVCPPGQIKCSEHDICIKREHWCNGVEECPNGEDEPKGCEETGICGKDQFMCKNGVCIKSKDRCNSHYDCADKSDEEGCNFKRECRTSEFQCHEGGCISKFLVCNGDYDCSDYSDELNCGSHTCPPNTFMCNTRSCIPKEWECDGEVDCEDGSDEREECEAITCGEGKFTCANYRCVSSSLKCNGFDDCGDGSDEQHCPKKGHGHFGNCTDDEYPCYNTDMCLPKTVRCNGVQDCPKNDDEHNCANCNEDEFACENKKCILQSWVCDRIDDCGDKSDEKECDIINRHNIDAKINTSKCKEFTCSIGTCLPFDRVCNGISDCQDNSDEYGKCTTSCVQNNRCEGLCHETPLGGVCGCQEGYHLAANNVSCDDINECEKEVCSQMCHNTVGSFHCSCFDGYVIRSDKISCKVIGPSMELITTTDDDIRKVSSNFRSIDVIHSLSGSSLTGLDTNAIDDTVYWSSDESGTINKINIKTKENMKTIQGVGNPEVLAIDWITNNVYFNDNDRPNMIKICNFEQEKCAKLIKIAGKEKVGSIIVHPQKRWLFWSQTTWKIYDNPLSEIYRTNMLGSEKKVIGSRNIGVVSGMAIDHIKSKLYWADSFHKIIESSNLDGSQRNVILTADTYQPLSVSIYENSLYWLMGSYGQLRKCKMYGKRLCETINIGPESIHKYFAIMHISKHPLAENPCKKLNCDYMCVLKDNDGACICQNGKEIRPNSTCTKNIDDNVIFSSVNTSINVRKYSSINGIIIVTVIVIMLLSVYCYYQRNKLKIKKVSNHRFSSIHFQNPSYDRRDEVAATINSVAPKLSAGEHEYMNPLNDKLLEIAKESTAQRLDMLNYMQSEKEVETENQNVSLVSFVQEK